MFCGPVARIGHSVHALGKGRMQPVERSQLSTRIHEPCTNARSPFMTTPNCLLYVLTQLRR